MGRRGKSVRRRNLGRRRLVSSAMVLVLGGKEKRQERGMVSGAREGVAGGAGNRMTRSPAGRKRGSTSIRRKRIGR